MKKADIIKTLEKRAEHFNSTHHSYESREIWSAIDVIERLMPTELFSIPVVSQQRELLLDEMDKYLMLNTKLDVRDIFEFKERFKQ